MQEIVCAHCGNRLSVPDDLQGKAVRCPYCKTRLESTGGSAGSPAPTPPGPEHWNDEGEEDYDDRPRRRRRRRHEEHTGGSGLAITALVMGIVAFPGTCLCSIFSGVFSIMAIIFGIIGLKSPGRGMALTGLILGIVHLVLLTIFFIIYVVILANDPNLMRQFR